MCPDGEHSKPGSSACEKCSTGKYYDEASYDCKFCPKNTASISGASNISGCIECQVEKQEYAYSGSGYCSVCPQHEVYNNSLGECTCIDTFIRDVDKACVCKEGWTLKGTECAPCEEGKWKDSQSVNSCTRCGESLIGSITTYNGSTSRELCICPEGFFDNEKEKCQEVVRGVSTEHKGLTLRSLWLKEGFWRTGPTSLDIRRCKIRGACLGGNGTNGTSFCREGHYGPYCSLCLDGHSMDSFGTCLQCEVSHNVFRMFTLFISILIFASIFYKKENSDSSRSGEGQSNNYQEHQPGLAKRLKNGAKIIFVATQIVTSLPSVMPSVSLPEILSGAVKAAQALNLNIFKLMSIGCWATGITYYDMVIGLCLLILSLTLLLVILGQVFKRLKSRFATAAIALTYLTLPTVTTSIFGLFPCDDFDDGRKLLRFDYNISCLESGRGLIIAFGVIMVLIFPIGVTSGYAYLLWRRKDKLLDLDPKSRSNNPDLNSIVFLWEAYLPEFWYWELVETARRLMMTG